MPDLPRCTSWRGHKFEPRYSLGLPPSLAADVLDQFPYISLDAERNLTKAPKTYERDICVRCGATVEKTK